MMKVKCISMLTRYLVRASLAFGSTAGGSILVDGRILRSPWTWLNQSMMGLHSVSCLWSNASLSWKESQWLYSPSKHVTFLHWRRRVWCQCPRSWGLPWPPLLSWSELDCRCTRYTVQSGASETSLPGSSAPTTPAKIHDYTCIGQHQSVPYLSHGMGQSLVVNDELFAQGSLEFSVIQTNFIRATTAIVHNVNIFVKSFSGWKDPSWKLHPTMIGLPRTHLELPWFDEGGQRWGRPWGRIWKVLILSWPFWNFEIDNFVNISFGWFRHEKSVVWPK